MSRNVWRYPAGVALVLRIAGIISLIYLLSEIARSHHVFGLS